MTHHVSPPSPRDVVRLLVQYWLRWLLPAALITLAALFVAVTRKPTWEASQALVLREEGVGKSTRTGRFESVEAMKTAQEMIMELSKSQSVLTATLMAVDGNAPSSAAVDELRDAIKIKAPHGIEFGQSEVFYLSLKDRSRKRAIELTRVLGQQLDQRLRELREQKANSLVNELSESVALARTQLDQVTRQLSEMERALGGDLAELRILNTVASGESNLRQTLIHLKNELRQATLERQMYDELLRILRAAESDPSQLIATPNHLLQAQPNLQRLKDGLVDAQLRAAQLQGELSAEHPRVKAALAGQQQIATRLHSELASAIGGVEAQRRIIGARVALLESQASELNARMAKIAEVRPAYDNLTSDVHNRAELLKREQNELAVALASRQAARANGQLSSLDEPATGDRPVGPGRAMIVLAGIGGGLFSGWGLVFLTVPWPMTPAIQPPKAPAVGAAAVQPAPPTPERPAGNPGVSDWLATGSNRVLSLKEALKDFLCVSPHWN